MSTTTVVVEGGGSNLYEIEENGGHFKAYHVRVNLLLPNSKHHVGSARSFEGALSLIRSHSGKDIKRFY